MSDMFERPDTEDIRAEAQAEDKSNKGVREIDNAARKADERTRELGNEQYETEKRKLDPNADKNIARGEGTYGMYNNRDYSTTLRLAREADAYNNKPIDHMRYIGTHHLGGIRDLGTGYDRPNIETMEMRAMEQAKQLDTNQKQLAQELQAAVNRKDLDTFIMLYKQLYGIELTRMEAEQAMRTFTRQREISNILTKDITQFNELFGRWFKTDTVQVLYNLAKTDNLWAQALSNILYGMSMPTISDTMGQSYIWTYIRTKYPNFDNMSPTEQYKAWNDAEQHLANTEQQMANEAAASTTRNQNTKHKFAAWKTAKERDKENK